MQKNKFAIININEKKITTLFIKCHFKRIENPKITDIDLYLSCAIALLYLQQHVTAEKTLTKH